ncbi:hypothetical protein HanRHA438_Chr17g0820541 [Helianthus annuus]|nr:hypothetical protein HanRHA438_Chr17g0820541 [Helianthus annuus]
MKMTMSTIETHPRFSLFQRHYRRHRRPSPMALPPPHNSSATSLSLSHRVSLSLSLLSVWSLQAASHHHRMEVVVPIADEGWVCGVCEWCLAVKRRWWGSNPTCNSDGDCGIGGEKGDSDGGGMDY